MTEFAVGRKPGCDMVRVLRALVIVLMARITFLWSPLVDVVYMAGAAVQGGMGSKQWIKDVMIQAGPAEARIGYPVAFLAERGEACGNVVRIPGAFIISLVAVDTKDRKAEDVFAGMAFFAVQRPVSCIECDPCR